MSECHHTKACGHCKARLPLEAFSNDASRKDGLDSYCRPCKRKAEAAWKAANPERKREQKQRERLKHHDRYIAYGRAYFAAHQDALNDQRRHRRLDNIEAERAAGREWRRLNPEKIREGKRAYHLANRDRRCAKMRQHYVIHREEYLDRAVLRRKRERQATPRWADSGAILAIYREARRLSRDGLIYHVDHIVPLRGRGVCGLHVPSNLQIIPAYENLTKSVKFDDHHPLQTAASSEGTA